MKRLHKNVIIFNTKMLIYLQTNSLFYFYIYIPPMLDPQAHFVRLCSYLSQHRVVAIKHYIYDILIYIVLCIILKNFFNF